MIRNESKYDPCPELDERILVGDRARAAAAASGLDQERKYRDQFIPAEGTVARHADGAAMRYRFARIESIDDDVEETPDDAAKEKNKDEYQSEHAYSIPFEYLN
jgi:hypothetical protein